MADFTSSFWSWFIIIPVLGGIAGLFWLNRWMTTPPRKSDEKPVGMGHQWDEDLYELNNPLPRWWLNLFYITLVFSLGYLVLYPGLGSFAGALGWTSKGQYEAQIKKANARFDPLYEKYLREPLVKLVRDPEAIKTGERLFITYCTVCHGADARGGRGYPNLRDNDWLWGGEPEAIKTSIMQGRTGVMPPWGAALGQEGVFNVTEYVISLSGKRVVNVNAAADGKEKYQQVCASCHGVDGKGNKAMGAPNLTDDIWLYGSGQKDIMETIAKGRSGRMPAHAEFLGEAKAHIIAAYVYSLSNPPPGVKEARRP